MKSRPTAKTTREVKISHGAKIGIIKVLVAENLNAAEISRIIGEKKSTVIYWMRKNKISAPKPAGGKNS